MSIESHQRYADDLGAYLLDALSADETAALESHLAECPECRPEVDGLRAAADPLPRAAQTWGPPARGAGNVYEVWLKRGNQIEPSSLFSVSSNGTGAAAIPASLGGVDAVMVTSEKGPTGTMAPTSKPIIVAAT